MSEIQTGTTPDTTTAPIAPPVATAQPTPPARTLASDLPDDALAKRLEQAKDTARRALLAELGVDDPEKAKSALAAAKQAEEAKKSEAERLAAAMLRVSGLEQAVDVAVAEASAGITPAQKAAVDAIAGTDKAVWLRTLAALRPTWAAPTAPVAGAPPAPAATPPAVNTAPPASPIPPPSSTSPVDHASVRKAASAVNPFYGAAYLAAHPEAAKRP